MRYRPYGNGFQLITMPFLSVRISIGRRTSSTHFSYEKAVCPAKKEKSGLYSSSIA